MPLAFLLQNIKSRSVYGGIQWNPLLTSLEKLRQITTHEERKCFRRVCLLTSFCNLVIKLTFTLADLCVCLFLVWEPPVGQGLLWMSDQLVAETSTWQHTQHSQQINVHAPGGIRTHNLSRRAAADLCLRLCGHWDRLTRSLVHINSAFKWPTVTIKPHFQILPSSMFSRHSLTWDNIFFYKHKW